MAINNTNTRLITFTSNQTLGASTRKFRVAGVVATCTSATALGRVKLQDYAGTLDIIPAVVMKSGTSLVAGPFVPPIEVLGLKAASCTGANIRVQIE